MWKFFTIFQLRHAHMRKDTSLSLRNASDEKLGGAWEQGWNGHLIAPTGQNY